MSQEPQQAPDSLASEIGQLSLEAKRCSKRQKSKDDKNALAQVVPNETVVLVALDHEESNAPISRLLERYDPDHVVFYLNKMSITSGHHKTALLHLLPAMLLPTECVAKARLRCGDPMKKADVMISRLCPHCREDPATMRNFSAKLQSMLSTATCLLVGLIKELQPSHPEECAQLLVLLGSKSLAQELISFENETLDHIIEDALHRHCDELNLPRKYLVKPPKKECQEMFKMDLTIEMIVNAFQASSFFSSLTVGTEHRSLDFVLLLFDFTSANGIKYGKSLEPKVDSVMYWLWSGQPTTETELSLRPSILRMVRLLSYIGTLGSASVCTSTETFCTNKQKYNPKNSLIEQSSTMESADANADDDEPRRKRPARKVTPQAHAVFLEQVLNEFQDLQPDDDVSPSIAYNSVHIPSPVIFAATEQFRFDWDVPTTSRPMDPSLVRGMSSADDAEWTEFLYNDSFLPLTDLSDEQLGEILENAVFPKEE